MAVFALIRLWQRRSGRVRTMLLGGYSPMPGSIIFFSIAVLIVCAWAHGTPCLTWPSLLSPPWPPPLAT